MVADFIGKCIKQAQKQPNNPKQEDQEMDSSDSEASVSSKKAVQKPKIQNRQNKRERDDHPPLKRPIIFICNDFYGKNTVPLKEIVLAIKVEAANKSQILDRVSHILRQENIENIQIGLV